MEHERKDRPDGPRRRRKPASVRRMDDVRPREAKERQQPRITPARRINWGRYGIEFLVIVAGIMVSFLLNEWRQERSDRLEERRLLMDLLDDIRQDSLIMALEVEELGSTLQLGKRLLAHQTNRVHPDSVLAHLLPLMSYTAVPFTQVTYHSMRATRTASLIRDRGLLRDILELHESRYFGLREMFNIDRFQVVERMFPVTERHIRLSEADTERLDQLLADPEWRNLAFHGLLFKKKIATMLTEEIAHGDTLMRRIERQLEP